MISKNVDRRLLLAGLGGAVAGSLLSAARAGDLTPPPGPIVPSGRGLGDLYNRIARTERGVAEPRCPVESVPGTDTATHVIRQSGSYYMTQNLMGEPNKHAVVIDAPDVDFDMCGFHIIGLPGSASGSGITTTHENVTVCDGSVRGFSIGVDFELASRFILMDLVSIGSAKTGFAAGTFGQIDDCDAYGSGTGFSARKTNCLFEDCGAWSCAIGFGSPGSHNLFLCNCATDCGVPFEIGPENGYGPIVFAIGDMSAIPNGNHPWANHVY